MAAHEPMNIGTNYGVVMGTMAASSGGNNNVTVKHRYNYNSSEDPLKLLPIATDAEFNSYESQQQSTCLPNTRVDILRKILQWADREDQQYICWLSGMAGTGKSTIARTVARQLLDKEQLGASFFFSKGGGDVGNARKFVSTISVQLTKYIKPVEHYIRDAVTECRNIEKLSLMDQWDLLVLKPLSKLKNSNKFPSYIVIIDALDECGTETEIQLILQLLTKARLLKTTRLRILLTSRPEASIRHIFRRTPDVEHYDCILDDIEPVSANNDISMFFKHEIESIGHNWSLQPYWPSKKTLNQLILNASGLFIWAATACRFIREGGSLHATKRLSMLLSDNRPSSKPEDALNEMYRTVLENTIHEEYSDDEKEETYRMLKQVLGTIVLLYSPLSIESISELLNSPGDEPVDHRIILDDLHAILHIPQKTHQPLRLHHPSFRDFLIDNQRCTDPEFCVDKNQMHQMLVESCLRLMSTFLKQDILGTDTPGISSTDIESKQVEQCLSSEVQYACLYWVQHLQKSNIQLENNGEIHRFLQKHFLHWLEALSWIGKISEGILALGSLESHISVNKDSELYTFIHDAKRFLLHNRIGIEQAPLQIYCSALFFAPEESIIRKTFQDCIPNWIYKISRTRSNWSAALQTLEGHSGWVNSVAFSPDGKVVASGSSDKTIRLWDVATGESLRTLEGHSDSINSIAFSPDSKVIASGSSDKTIRLWDIATGESLQTFEGHSAWINSIAFLSDNKIVAFDSSDKTIRLWDITIGKSLRTFEGHSDWINSVAFSPDGKVVASSSNDTTIRLWDVATGESLRTLESHSDWVESVAFSLDSKVVASGSYDGMIRLWDVATGELLQIFEGYSNWIESIAFSPDGKVIAFSSNDKTIRLWDVAMGESLRTLEGHSDSINSVAFSPDSKMIASGSNDKTIRLWDIAMSESLRTLEGHSGSINSIAFSPDGKVVASSSSDKTIWLWDVIMGKSLRTLKGHSAWVNSIAFSSDGKVVASGSNDTTIRLWDVAIGKSLRTLEGHSSPVWSVAFSLDDKVVASGSRDKTIRLWDVATGESLRTLESHSDWVNSVAFSPDGKVVASGSSDKTIRLWDIATGESLRTLEGHSGSINSIAFSPDGKAVASGSDDKTIRLWDVATGESLQTLENHSGWIRSVAFSLDSKVVASSSSDETIRLWDVATGESLQAFEGHWGIEASSAFKRYSISNHWIVEIVDGEIRNTIWLPPDYRPSCTSCHKGIIAIGVPPGSVFILKLEYESFTFSKSKQALV